MKKDIELKHHQTLEEIKQLDSYTDKATAMFTITQTEEKLKRDNIQETIKDLGGTMPEDLPTPKDSVNKIEKSHKSLEVKKQ